MWRGFGFFLVTYLLVTIVTLIQVPRATRNLEEHPWAWLIVLLNILAVANIPRAIFQRRPGYAFPNLITSSPNPDHSLTIYNAASSATTLKIMAIIAAIGMPFVLVYTGIVYWTFRGAVRLEEHSY